MTDLFYDEYWCYIDSEQYLFAELHLFTRPNEIEVYWKLDISKVAL